jgi:hypothetical protein
MIANYKIGIRVQKVIWEATTISRLNNPYLKHAVPQNNIFYLTIEDLKENINTYIYKTSKRN